MTLSTAGGTRARVNNRARIKLAQVLIPELLVLLGQARRLPSWSVHCPHCEENLFMTALIESMQAAGKGAATCSACGREFDLPEAIREQKRIKAPLRVDDVLSWMTAADKDRLKGWPEIARGHLGRLPDELIARSLGVNQNDVRSVRMRKNIPGFSYARAVAAIG